MVEVLNSRAATLNDLSIDVVARAAGVSRATAYRHLGTREELRFRAAITLAQAHVQRCMDLLDQLHGAAAKIEEAFAYTARESMRDPLLQVLLLESRRTTGIDDAIHSLSDQITGPVIAAGQVTGEIRGDLSVDEIISWLVEQLYVMLRLRHDDVSARTWVRTFVLPCLFPWATDGGGPAEVRARLALVAERVRELDEAVTAVCHVAGGSSRLEADRPGAQRARAADRGRAEDGLEVRDQGAAGLAGADDPVR
jgi:AcrR family transcriptional regulator